MSPPFSQYAGKAVTADRGMAITRVQFDGPSTEVTPRMLTELIFGVLFAGVVLLITFGALLPAGLPLLSALIGVGVVMGGITSVAAFTTVSSTAPLLAGIPFLSVMGVGAAFAVLVAIGVATTLLPALLGGHPRHSRRAGAQS